MHFERINNTALGNESCYLSDNCINHSVYVSLIFIYRVPDILMMNYVFNKKLNNRHTTIQFIGEVLAVNNPITDVFLVNTFAVAEKLLWVTDRIWI